jgi:branched-chain amino acid transport system permease protein
MSSTQAIAAAGQALRTPGRLAALALALVVLVTLPLVLPPFETLQVSYGLIFGIAALGFNLLLGYTGLLSFGHSAFFGTGAYVAAFLVKYWDIRSMEAFIVAGVLGSLLVAAIIGAVCVRYTRIFFGILALALSQVLWSLALKLFWVTGGTDGLRVPTPSLLGGAISGTLGAATDKTAFLAHRYYYYVLAVFVISTAVMWVIVHSPFGKALQAIRDNEVRAEFVGVQVRRYRYVAFLVSGAFTGLAGALWVPLNGLTTPDVLYWPFSGRIVFMAVLGGFRTFWGPVVGAFVYNYLEVWAVGTTVYWQLVLGVILVALVLAMPTGLVGTASQLLARARRGRGTRP